MRHRRLASRGACRRRCCEIAVKLIESEFCFGAGRRRCRHRGDTERPLTLRLQLFGIAAASQRRVTCGFVQLFCKDFRLRRSRADQAGKEASKSDELSGDRRRRSIGETSVGIAEPPTGGLSAGGSGKSALPDGHAGAVVSSCRAPRSDGDCTGGRDGASCRLPKMVGKPSLPLPMITIFEFVDCASCSVASMPRHCR